MKVVMSYELGVMSDEYQFTRLFSTKLKLSVRKNIMKT